MLEAPNFIRILQLRNFEPRQSLVWRPFGHSGIGSELMPRGGEWKRSNRGRMWKCVTLVSAFRRASPSDTSNTTIEPRLSRLMKMALEHDPKSTGSKLKIAFCQFGRQNETATHHFVGRRRPGVDERVQDGVEVLHDEDDVADLAGLRGAVGVEEHFKVEFLFHFEGEPRFRPARISKA